MKARPSPFAACKSGVRARVRVAPKASRSVLDGVETGADGRAYVKVRVTAAPEKGKANTAVRKLLAKSWGLAPGRMTVISGATARTKTIEIEGESAALLRTLGVWLKQQTREHLYVRGGGT